MKFQAERCKCGLDLTTATPVRVRGESIGCCPKCRRAYTLIGESKAGSYKGITPFASGLKAKTEAVKSSTKVEG
jgi:hypothetical protein